MTTYRTLQKIAQTRIDALAVELADKVRTRDRVTAQIDTLESQMSGQSQPKTNEPLIDGAFGAYVVRLRQQRDGMKEHIAVLDGEIAEVRLALSDAYQEKMRFQHLSDLHQQAEDEAQSARDQAELDDIAVSTVGR